MKFKAAIKDKTITFGNEAYARHHLGKYEGKSVYVEVTKIGNKRSLNQNAYYWACLSIISENTGHDPEELHRIFKGMFLPRKETILNGKKYYLAGSTADLNTNEFSEYFMRITAEASSMGITLPSPDEYKRGLDSAMLLTD